MLCASVNDFKHSLQVYGFTLECVLWCILRLPASVNNLEFFLQANDFSPELVLRWILRLHASLYDSEDGLSTECVLRWILSLPASANILGHSLQVNGVSPEYV